ncbi:NAD-dependent malic enzyme [Actinomyces minihominis]|uniref:NAD-dependent malic enzyme n=1 Tax=Actinomyces minihominis TaxID=2002838 RepID=UPI000C087271|nr:NAD-dependent malic enzyme [Actinomyces minihominis]
MPVSPSYTASYRLLVDESQTRVAAIVDVATRSGASIKGLDVAETEGGFMVLDATFDLRDSEHRREIRKVLQEMPGVSVKTIADQTFLDHIGGKISVSPRSPLRNRDDLSRVYTPGVARVCKSIHDAPSKARLLTMKANTVAVVTDGSAVLGLGDIGPEAALPVMEGKAVLFKHFGDVDAWPVVLDTQDTEEIISIVKALAPAYGGINLEDIAAPRCFEIEERLREELDIPVFHDDQHGTAIVVLAALINALKVTGKNIEDVRIIVSGVGAAGSAIIRLLLKAGAVDIIGYGRDGALSRDTIGDVHESRRWLAENTNPNLVKGSLKEGLVGADVFIGVSRGGILGGDDIRQMNEGAIVFALANPIPEVDPWEANRYAAVVATGRSDYPNQINNVLAFPGLFRGVLDALATEITEDVLHASATAIAGVIGEDELSENYIIPGVFDDRVSPAVAHATKKALVGASHVQIAPQEDLGAITYSG